MYTQEVKINFKENIFYYFTYVVEQSSNSVTALKLI